jgi:hypothetical protein
VAECKVCSNTTLVHCKQCDVVSGATRAVYNVDGFCSKTCWYRWHEVETDEEQVPAKKTNPSAAATSSSTAVAPRSCPSSTVVFVAPPFRGHFQILYEAAEQWALRNPQVVVHFVICGWSNVALPIKVDEFRLPYTYLHASSLHETDPNKFNPERATKLYAVLHTWLTQHTAGTSIQTIVYDFFCWEAARVGADLRIPTICSIPAIPTSASQDVHERTVTALLQNDGLRTALRTGEVEQVKLVSDALYLPGSRGQWLWAPVNVFEHFDALSWSLGCNVRPVELVSPTTSSSVVSVATRPGFHLYVSLGTVVTGNLLLLYPDPIRRLVRALFRTIHEWFLAATDAAATATFSIPGIADEIRSDLRATSRVRIVEFCDQRAELDKASLFVTHGGGNSLREAVESACPMAVLPFFGDQWHAAEHVERAGFGVTGSVFPAAFPNNGLSVRSTTAFGELTSAWPDASFDASVLGWLDKAFSSLNELKQNLLRSRNIDVVNVCDEKLDALQVDWHSGDLLFGTNAARVRFDKAWHDVGGARTKPLFCIGDVRPFSAIVGEQKASCENRYARPALIDQFNDVLRSGPEALSREIQRCRQLGFRAYENDLARFDAFLTSLHRSRPLTLDTRVDLEQVWRMCMDGMDAFLAPASSTCHIHFAISDFDATKNEATRRELDFLVAHQDRFRFKVSYYAQEDRTGAWYRTSNPMCSTDTGSSTRRSLQAMPETFEACVRQLQRVLASAPFATTVQPAWNMRIKEPGSVDAKLREGRRPVDDFFGVRLSYPYTQQLYQFAHFLIQATLSAVTWERTVVWEDGKIVYLYGYYGPHQHPLEVQLWPSIYLAAFQSEHDAIYKKGRLASAAEQAASAERRVKQRELQHLVDASAVLLL